MQLGHQADQRKLRQLGLKTFMGNIPIKNSVVDVSVRSGNCVRCKQNCVSFISSNSFGYDEVPTK